MTRHFGIALAIAGLCAAASAGAQERPALYEALELSGDFFPDPVVVPIEAGGDTDAASISDRCSGLINSEGPDITIDFSQPTAPLNIYALSDKADLTLAVRRPNGDWACDDDSDGTNPLVRLAKPASGAYAIWVGIIDRGGFVPATVLISQADPDWTYGGAMTADAATEDAPARQPPEIPFDVETGSRGEAIARATVSAIQALLGDEPDSLFLNVAAPVTAADDGRVVHVVLPGARLDGGFGFMFALGDLAIDVTPRDDDVFDFVVAMPPAMEVLQDDQKVGAIDYAAAALSGTWSTPLQALLDLDGRLAEVVVRDYMSGQEELKLRLSVLTLRQTLTAAADGRWSGPYRFELSGAEVFPGDGSISSLGNLLFEGTIEGLDLAGWSAVATEFGASPFLLRPQVDADRRQEFDRALAGVAWGRLAGGVSLSDLRISEGSAEAFRLGEFALRWQLDAREDVGDVGFGITAGGFAVELPDLPADLRPTRFALDVVMKRMPVKSLFAASLPSAEGMDQDPGGLLGILFQGDPSLSLTAFVLQTQALDVAAKGDVSVTDAGPQGAVDATIKGLARAVEALQQGGAGLPGAEELLPVLTALRDLPGAAAIAPDGVAEHRFRIELPAVGPPTVNGKPLEEVMP